MIVGVFLSMHCIYTLSLTDGAGYVEDGREIFDDDLNEEPGANKGSKIASQSV